MAKCAHENSVRLDTHDIHEQYQVEIVYEHGNLSSLQQLEGVPRMVTIETRWCADCSVVYGTVCAAA